MDPLTHTLVGGSLAATRLGEKTRLATASCVIGANLPDVDVLAFAWGVDAALGFRRGWTHGVLALVVLPLALAGLLRLWDRWWPPGRWPPRWWSALRRVERSRPPGEGAGDQPPRRLSPGWLVALCYLSVLTHPALDWLNNYGMRWLMPFDGRWFYGDSVFIVDPWLWLLLGTGWLVGRRRSWGLALLVGAPGALLLVRTVMRAPEFATAVALVVGALLTLLWWKPRHEIVGPRAATIGLTLGAAYIAALIAVHAMSESRVRGELAAAGFTPLDALLVAPMPANPLHWDVVFSHRETLHAGRFDWREGGLVLGGFERPVAAASDLWPRIEELGEPAGFLRWTRLPWLEEAPEEGYVYLMDARYTRSRTTGFGGTRVLLEEVDAGAVSRRERQRDSSRESGKGHLR